MSADLFAEFGIPQPAPASKSSGPRAGTGIGMSAGGSIPAHSNELDIFNDSGVWQSSAPTITTTTTTTTTAPQVWTQPAPLKKEESLWRRDNNGADVLFDASDDSNNDEDDDDFGDFETAAADPPPITRKTTDDFLKSQASFNDYFATLDVSTPPRSTDISPAVPRLQPPPALPQYGRRKSSTISITSPPPPPIDDDWADFMGAPVVSRADIPQRSKSTTNRAAPPPLSISNVKRDAKVTTLPSFSRPKQQDLLIPDDGDGDGGEDDFFATHLKPTSSSPKPVRIAATSTESSTSDLRPTNIPPPAILLSLFPQLFENLSSTLATLKQSTTPAATKLLLLSDLSATPTVAAHILAGRTHRWKRDTRLAQSMRIGQASRGGGGMKLTSLSKSEDIREQREAADVIEAWRKRAFAVNAALKSAGMPPVGTLRETMAVKVEAGALSAKEPCALCALKREERVVGVDGDVQDSFGEWWVDFWGHGSCKAFWEREREGLQSR